MDTDAFWCLYLFCCLKNTFKKKIIYVKNGIYKIYLVLLRKIR